MTQTNEVFDVFAEFATDPKLEVDGARFDLGRGAWGMVARADNRHYSRKLQKALETHREALAKEDETADALSNQVMAEIFASTILKGFGGLYDKGTLASYNYLTAVEMLKHQDFRILIGQKANEFGAFKAKQESEQGNS